MRKSRVHKSRRLTAAGLSIGTMVSLVSYGGTATAAPASFHHASYAGQTLTVLDGAPSGADATQTAAYYSYVAKLFKQQTGATLKWDYYSAPSQEVTDIETSTVSGSGPDVISYGTSFVGTLWATGDFAPLSSADWALLGGESSLMKSTLYDSGLTSSEYIGIPNETNPYVMAYNTKYFKEAGIASPPKSWGALVTDSQKIQAKIKGVYGIGIDPGDAYDPWKNMFFLDAQYGGGKPWEWINPAGTKVDLTTPQMEDAVKFYFGLEDQYHVAPPQSLTWDSADMASAFESGKVAMVILGNYGYLAAVKGTKAQGDLGFALLPTIPYGDTAMPANGIPIETETTGNYWAIPKYASKVEKLALTFEKVTLSPQVQLEQFKLLGWIPVNQAGIKAVEAYSPVAKTFIEAEEAAIPTSAAPVWSYVETGVLTAVKNIGTELATNGGKWDASYATAQLHQAQVAAQAHATGLK